METCKNFGGRTLLPKTLLLQTQVNIPGGGFRQWRTPCSLNPAFHELCSPRFMSLEGLQHVLRMFVNLQMTPEIETHKFALLRKFRNYEIRQYSNYMVAETAMPAGSGW